MPHPKSEEAMKVGTDDCAEARTSRRIGSGRGGTSARLVEAAAKEFAECGFEGTDTNKIARRAALRLKPFTDGLRTKQRYFLLSILNRFESSLSGRARS
jgi:hypothetical protein